MVDLNNRFMSESIEIEKILANALVSVRPLFSDARVTEIMVTADGVVWVERNGSIHKTEVLLTEAERHLAITAVASYVGRDLTKNTASALVSASIGGLRFAGALKPVDPRGSTLCIRKHQDASKRPTLEQLIEWAYITRDQADNLTRLIIHEKKNAVFIGPTSSGKTTLTNAILGLLPLHERIGLIEDAQELSLGVENKDCYLTNAQSGLTAKVIIQHAMRSRYDRLVLGETRGDDTYDLIRALSSGHNGSITTLHGNGVEEGLGSIEMLYQMSIPSGASVPVDVARKYIAKCINVAIFADREYQVDCDGNQKSIRKVKSIGLIKGVENGSYKIEYL